MAVKEYLGRCHCRRVLFMVKTDLENERKGICNCSSCTMRGFIHHHVDRGDFNLVTGFNELTLYKFGSLGAEHYFCKHCGVESFYRSRSDPEQWDVNVRCLFERNAAGTEWIKVNIYGFEYKISDGENWESSQKKRHEVEGAGLEFAPRRFVLLAPADELKTRSDVAAEFRKIWDGGAAPKAP